MPGIPETPQSHLNTTLFAAEVDLLPNARLFPGGYMIVLGEVVSLGAVGSRGPGVFGVSLKKRFWVILSLWWDPFRAGSTCVGT